MMVGATDAQGFNNSSNAVSNSSLNTGRVLKAMLNTNDHNAMA